MRQPAIRVLTVDDQALFRDAVRDLILATPGFRLVGEAANGPEALHAVQVLAPELVLLDVNMPGMDGLEVARRVSASPPRTMIVLISVDDPRRLPAARHLAGRVALARKQDLCPARLRQLWADGLARTTASAS